MNHTLHVGSWHAGQVGDSLQDETLFSMFLPINMLPRMSLSHHNTLYLKQPLLKATRFIPLRQLELPIGLWNVVVYCVYCGNLDTSGVHVAASCEWCGCLFCLSLMFLQRFDWLQLDLALIQTCLWSCELSVALCVMTCWTSGWQLPGWNSVFNVPC